MNKLPKNLKIILLANNNVGLEIAKILKTNKEKVVGLIIHNSKYAKQSRAIMNELNVKNIFYENQLKDKNVLRKLKSLKPDIAISAWFRNLLEEDFIKIFPFGCINLHNSFLPYNRGKYPHVWAIYEGSKYGVTIHFIDRNIDTGNIISQKEINIKITDIAGDVYERSLITIVELFKEVWPKFKAGKLKIFKQNEKIATHHFSKDVEKIDFIDLNKKYAGREIINKIRARTFSDRSYAYFLFKKKKIYVKLLLSEEQKF